MSEKYDDYLEEHTSNVAKAFKILYEVLTSEWFEKHNIDLNYMNLVIGSHDQSKFSGEEYSAYDDYFYSGQSSEDINKEFDYAWLHHIHTNPHHWQFWILRNDDGTIKSLDMPGMYIIEMICDWMSFSIKKGRPSEWIEFYRSNDNILVSDNTRSIIEDIIEKFVIVSEVNPNIFNI